MNQGLLPGTACSPCVRRFRLPRVTSCDYLTEDGEVGINSEVCLGTARSDPETGNYFVEYEKSAVLVSQLLAAPYEFSGYRPGAALGSHGLDEYSSRAASEFVLS